MPIYEYVCERCGECTEAIQRMGDAPLQECLKCGGPLRKKVSAPAFQFKGTGWYVTDYARKGESGGKSDSSGGKSDSSSSSSSSSSESSGGDDSSAGPVKKADPKPETAGKSSKD